MKVEYFFEGIGIKVKIDHKNKAWYDQYGKLIIENIFQELTDEGLTECNEINRHSGLSVWCIDDKIYHWRNSEILKLKENGTSTMSYEGRFKEHLSINNQNDLAFLKWYYNTDNLKEISKIINH